MALKSPPANGFKKGQKKPEGSGRKAGVLNKATLDLKEALLESASLLGYLRKEPILDEEGKADGRGRDCAHR
jgi:hypothetical protein